MDGIGYSNVKSTEKPSEYLVRNSKLPELKRGFTFLLLRQQQLNLVKSQWSSSWDETVSSSPCGRSSEGLMLLWGYLSRCMKMGKSLYVLPTYEKSSCTHLLQQQHTLYTDSPRPHPHHDHVWGDAPHILFVICFIRTIFLECSHTSWIDEG